MTSIKQFTDRSLEVVRLAKKEASRFGHEYIGCEHFIIALAKECGGIAARALKESGIEAAEIECAIEEVVAKEPMVCLGKKPETPRLRKCISVAIEECRNSGDEFVDTGHLLIGILNDTDGIPHRAFELLNVNPVFIRNQVCRLQQIIRSE